MTAAEVLLELLERDVEIRAVEGQLHCRHQEGALSPALIARVREHKTEILELLADPDALRLAMALVIFDGELVEDEPLPEVRQLDLLRVEQGR